jgi:hypothetical protein
MLGRKDKKPEQPAMPTRRPDTLGRGKQRPVLDRRRLEDGDEIDERELDKISGGRMFRVDC